jgi:hypothetical protein
MAMLKSKKGRRRLVILLVAFGVVAVCAAAPGCRPQTPLALTPPWQAGEFSRLVMSNSATGERIGDWDTRVERDPAGGGYVLSTSMTTADASERASVTVSAGDLTPSFMELQGEGGAAKMMVLLRATYSGGKVTGAITQDGVGQPYPSLKLPKPPYFDNEQVVFVLRALPLAEGYKVTLNVIVTRGANKAQIAIAVGAAESVTVPAGTFDCWPVELVGLGQKFWIAVDEPHQLVQFANSGSAIISKLEEFRPGP